MPLSIYDTFETRFEVNSFYRGIEKNVTVNGNLYIFSQSILDGYLGTFEDHIILISTVITSISVQFADCIIQNNKCGDMVYFNDVDTASSFLISGCCFYNNTCLYEKSIFVSSHETEINNCVFTMNDCSQHTSTGLITFLSLKKQTMLYNNISHNTMYQGIGSYNSGLTAEPNVGFMVFMYNKLLGSNVNRYQSSNNKPNFFEVYSNADTTSNYHNFVYINNTVYSGSALFFLRSKLKLYGCLFYMHDDCPNDYFVIYNPSNLNLIVESCKVRDMAYFNNNNGASIGTSTEFPDVNACGDCGPPKATPSSTQSVSLTASVSPTPSHSTSSSPSISVSSSPSHSISSTMSQSPSHSFGPTSSPSESISASFTLPRTYPPQGCALTEDKVIIKVLSFKNSLLPLLAGFRLQK